MYSNYRLTIQIYTNCPLWSSTDFNGRQGHSSTSLPRKANLHCNWMNIRVFPKIMVGPPKWMVKINGSKPYEQMGWFGGYPSLIFQLAKYLEPGGSSPSYLIYWLAWEPKVPNIWGTNGRSGPIFGSTPIPWIYPPPSNSGKWRFIGIPY